MTAVLLAIGVFTSLIMALSIAVLVARRLLMPHGLARIAVNGERVLDADLGEKLLHALAHGGVRLPSGCGGAGTCGLCRVVIHDAADALPIERSTLHGNDIAKGVRLACQTVVRGDLRVHVPEQSLAAHTWTCAVTRTRSVAPLIKEVVFARPACLSDALRAGAYVEVVAPAYELPFDEIDIEAAHAQAWQRLDIRRLVARASAPVARAYSLANYPDETEDLILNIRLALPPSGQPEVPPGIVSSYLFGLKTGDSVTMSGPFGDFFVQDSEREIVLIGGGVGMAPLRAHVFDQLERKRTSRRVSYWYGARSAIDLYYVQDMERLAREHANFSWHVALSAPSPDDHWEGEIGFVHDLVYRRHLQDHRDPTACEYYVCGPPLMIEAVRALLARLGVPPAHILCDDFSA